MSVVRAGTSARMTGTHCTNPNLVLNRRSFDLLLIVFYFRVLEIEINFFFSRLTGRMLKNCKIFWRTTQTIKVILP